MKRRAFLKATLLTAGAVVVGCGTKTETSTDAGQGADAGGGDADATADAGAAYEDGAAFFTLSVCSGDPRPDGAILWTRIADVAMADKDVSVGLQVAADAEFKTLIELAASTVGQLVGKAKHDHCVKARLVGLAAGQTWYYRFLYTTGGKTYASRTAHFKTAPAADSDVPVKFAVASCQDYNGHYYNSYARMAQEDLDFFLHLGDYIYETTGNPSFQDIDAARRVTFSDPASALAFNAGTKDAYFAAKSLSNYRDLYKTYRSDPDIQLVHERMPMIAIADDHEFSDDCWGAHAAYFDGASGDELSLDRRGAADQAWFEYMPVDFATDANFEFDAKAEFPGNLRAYRDFGYGKHIHVVMTDLRRYRSDHLVPEDAFPGSVMVTQEQAQTAVGKLPDSAAPYFDVDAFQAGIYATLLKTHATALNVTAARVGGLLSASWVNARIAELNKTLAADKQVAAIAEADLKAMKRGYAFHHLLKNSEFTSLGARYLVTEEAFSIYAKTRWTESKGASEVAMGDVQQKWFADTLKASTRTWKVWGNEYTFQRRLVDLSGFASLPDAFRKTFLLSAEDWDGLPNRREEVLGILASVPNTVIVSGDIHAFFAGTPMSATDPQQKVVEFVSGAISSGTYKTLLFRQASSDPALAAAGAAGLALLAGDLMLGKLPGVPPINSNLGFASLDQHGFTKIEADSKVMNVTYFQTPEATSATRLSADKVTAAFAATEFRVQAGSRDLQQKIGGAWKTWDPKKFDWI